MPPSRPLSLRYQITRFLLRLAGPTPVVILPRQRRTLYERVGRLLIVPKGTRVELVDAGGVPAEWVVGPRGGRAVTIFYLHGGGYLQGSPTTHRDFASHLSSLTGGRSVVVDYRLAPADPFPAAVEDACKAYRWLVGEAGVPPQEVVFAGDSAGGGLAVAALTCLRDEGAPMPAGVMCFSPWTDLTCSSGTLKSNSGKDPLLSSENICQMAHYYLNGADPTHPLASPIYADLSSLPPIHIQVGSIEILLDDARHLAERGRTCGVRVTLDIWQGMLHVWQLGFRFIPEGADALAQAAAFIRSRVE